MRPAFYCERGRRTTTVKRYFVLKILVFGPAIHYIDGLQVPFGVTGTSHVKRAHIATMLALILSGAVVVIGCGSGDRGPVAHWQGKVTIDGRPLPADAQARIFFAPSPTASEPTAPPAIVEVENGRYDATNVPAGSVAVTFEIRRPTGQEIPREGSIPLKEYEDLVPLEHRSGMLLEIAEGEKTHDFDL
jgi:hypothetical protein